jgi:hypothetical protein
VIHDTAKGALLALTVIVKHDSVTCASLFLGISALLVAVDTYRDEQLGVYLFRHILRQTIVSVGAGSSSSGSSSYAATTMAW